MTGRTMRTLWPALAATLLVLGGCGSEPDPDDAPATPPATPSSVVTPTSVVTPSAPAAPAGAEPTGTRSASGPQAFVATVRTLVPEAAADRGDDEIAGVAERACASLAAGTEAGGVVAGTRSLGTVDAEAVDQATARELVRLAIDTVCPDQDRRVDEF